MESHDGNGDRPRPKAQSRARNRRGKKITDVLQSLELQELEGPVTEYRYPDFICIGAQKAGTTWLDKNLRRHPRLWLPPVKELQYFSTLHIRKTQTWGSRHRSEKGMKILAQYTRKNNPQEWDFRYIARLADIVAGPISDDWYGRIFALAPADRTCGEITPDYSTLPPVGIEHLLQLSPHARIIFSMRDPIERSWSHIRMLARSGGVDDLATFEKFASGAELLNRANYPVIIANWRRFIPADRFLPIFLDDIESAPHEVLNEICTFLGVEYDPRLFKKSDNPIHVGEAQKMPSNIEAILKERLKLVYDGVAQLYPEIGAAWMARHY